MTRSLQCSVVIIGAGPTGLMAANQLMRFGIDFIILDKKAGPTRESRAILVTARSLEIYQQLGLVKDLLSGGKLVKSFNIYSGGRRMIGLTIGEMGKGLSEFSYIVAYEQSKNEELLARNLQENGKSVYWNYEFVDLKETDTAVLVTAKNSQEVLSIKADYLIACDGASSPVRTGLNFSFKGGTYDHKFFVADTTIEWNRGYDQLILTPGSENFCAFFPLYGDNNVRMIGTLPRRYAQRDNISFQDLKDTILRTSRLEIGFKSVNWFSVYKLHHRGVDHFSEGRVFLAGDSAHIHSPAGGQGMNTGLQDAYNLSWKLAVVLRKLANPAILDTYNEERLPFAKWLLQFTDRGFTMMTSSNWFIRCARRYIGLPIAGLLMRSKRVKAFAFTVVSQIWYGYRGKSLSGSFTGQALRFRSGDRVPFFAGANIYLHLTAASFHLVHIDDDPLSEERQVSAHRLFSFGVKVVEIRLEDNWKKLGVKGELFLLVRPDNYIMLVFEDLNDSRVKEHLGRFFT